MGEEGKDWRYGMALNLFAYFIHGILLNSVKLARLYLRYLWKR